MMSGDRRSSSLTQAQSFNQEKQQQPVFQGPNHVVSAVNGERRPSTASACLGVESGRREGSMSADDKGNTTRADSFGAGRDGHNLIGCAMVSSSCVTKSSESASSALNASDFGIKGVNNTSLPGPTSGKHNLASPEGNFPSLTDLPPASLPTGWVCRRSKGERGRFDAF